MPIKEGTQEPAAAGAAPEKAESSQPSPKVAEQIESTKAPTHFKCRTISSFRAQPGTVVTRWGHNWTVSRDGRTLEAMIPAYDIENGVGAGRWMVEGMPETERSEIFWRTQYREVFGVQPASSLGLDEVKLAIDKETAKRAGAKDTEDKE